MKKRLFALTIALMMLAAACALADAATFTVTIYDSDGLTVLNEIAVASGAVLTPDDLGVSREGYTLSGVFVTPALLRPYDGSPITRDTALFVAWQSAKADERAWMLAGSLTGYPANNWGHAWPQDDFLLKPVEGAFNTFEIELNLYEGDEFKIAVIDQDYNWYDNLGSSCLASREYVAGGEDAFATGANCKVAVTGLYKLTFVTDAETLELCKLHVERLGDAAAPEYVFDLRVHASFLGWDEANAIPLARNGNDYMWYAVFETTEDGEFGVKNFGSTGWFSGDDGMNIQLPAGRHILYVGLTADNQRDFVEVYTPAYYVVGTCGTKGWGADANEANEAYRMIANEDGTYALKVAFTANDTDSWTDGKVAVKVAFGAGGRVANEHWYGTPDGGNIMLDPGEYTITFDPATGAVTF